MKECFYECPNKYDAYNQTFCNETCEDKFILITVRIILYFILNFMIYCITDWRGVVTDVMKICNCTLDVLSINY